MSERNIRIVVEYDGTDYCGWQTQSNGPTVQQTIEESIEDLVGHSVTLHGSGRTDSGVHALGQTANFHTWSEIPAARMADAINSKLPYDIVVLSADDVSENFHARYSAVHKTYRYLICNRAIRPALERNRCWFFRGDLDVEKMSEAAAKFVGKHDFAAFCAEPPDNTVRTVIKASVTSGEHIVFEVTADGFLYNMVRRMVGSLVDVGRGRMVPIDIRKLLLDREGKAGPTAPPQGLYLVNVDYDSGDSAK